MAHGDHERPQRRAGCQVARCCRERAMAVLENNGPESVPIQDRVKVVRGQLEHDLEAKIWLAPRDG
jgi:hypothetical protein